jgi:hypothetical protein
MREITRKNYVQNREQFILDKCKGKKVLHLGCCDSPATEFKFNKGVALFQRIEKVCKAQEGLDIDQKSMDYLHDMGYKNVSFFDLNKPGKVDFKPDVIVFADTLEHLMNLETVLTSLKGLMNEKVELIITVPNATMFERVIGNFRGYIHEHDDHKVSFTYTALKQLLLFNQLDVSDIFLSDQLNIDREVDEDLKESLLKTSFLLPFRAAKFIIRKGLVSFFPLFSECLIIVCKIKKL